MSFLFLNCTMQFVADSSEELCCIFTFNCLVYCAFFLTSPRSSCTCARSALRRFNSSSSEEVGDEENNERKSS